MLPAVTRFALFEKGGSNGVTHEDYVKLKTTIRQICEKNDEYRSENFLNEAELNHKIGNVLYYKNSGLFDAESWGWSNDEIVKKLLRLGKIKTPGKNYPVDALHVYLDNLKGRVSEIQMS